MAFRTGVNIQDPEDVAQAQALQAKLSVTQAKTGEFIQPNQWDLEQMMALRAAYNEERNEKGVKSESLFGRPGESPRSKTTWVLPLALVDYPRKVLFICFYTPSSSEPQTLTLKDVPNGDNAFWSLTVYDKDGFPSW